MVLAAGWAVASGPRYVTGKPFFTGPTGVAIGWKQANLMYSTDPGSLGAEVNHEAADALVAAAAGVWNVPVASITVAQGGALAEHVSGQNVYLSSEGMVWPADVMSANAVAVPIAVVYDTDGSVTEALLGAGASDPSGCAQNAVTESVDRFDPAGYIVHAIVVLNGRCTGPAPEQQMQMQYQLERVFGRVLGLAWSQLNDNVFTGIPAPNYDQALHWPIMHPLEILCGPYSYQCLPNAFELRPDDVAGLVGVYPNLKGVTPALGKQVSLSGANSLNGTITFPTGEGMAGVNVLVKRGGRNLSYKQDWFEGSAVSGSSFQRMGSSPFVAVGAGAGASFGSTSAPYQGYYFVPYFMVADLVQGQEEFVSIEPVNPLYVGSASVGPYGLGMVSEAGSAPAPYVWQIVGEGYGVASNFVIPDAPATCGDGSDGTPAEPMQAPASGWWNGLLCGFGHASYAALSVKAGRSLTVEVTALDANGFATTSKAMPVIGLFAPTDGAGALPSLAVAPAAFQALGLGTTTLSAEPFPSGAGGTVRIGVADQRGDGRPDFAYQARVFYADALTPTVTAGAGGTVTVTGMGFRAGNEVMINGVEAQVTSWSANQIVVTAPGMAAVGAVSGTPVDVVVSDLGTGALSTITAALTYETVPVLQDVVRLVSAPSGLVAEGAAAAAAFAVQVLASDGVTPIAGQVVSFSVSAARALFGICGAAVCQVVTDGNGIASTPVTPTAAGTVTLQAAADAQAVSASFNAVIEAGSMIIMTAPTGNLPTGVVSSVSFQVKVLGVDGKTGLAGQAVVFSVAEGDATYGGCFESTCSVMTNAAGLAQVGVTPSAAGPVTLQASNGHLEQQASFVATANADGFLLIGAPTASVHVNQNAGNFTVRLVRGDGVTPVGGAAVVLSGSAGVSFGACRSSVCTLQTGGDGSTGSAVLSSVAGSMTVQAAYGGATISATFVVTVAPPIQLSILSAPTGSVNVGTAAPVPFTAQLLRGNGAPFVGAEIALGAAAGAVVMNCKLQPCFFVSDANGIVTTPVTPVVAGNIILNATWLNQNVSASFTSVGSPQTLTMIATPPPNVAVGDRVNFSYEVLGSDGITPLPQTTIWLTVTQGTFGFSNCQTGMCKESTGRSGILATGGVAYVPGPVTVVANSGAQTITTSFVVSAKAYTMTTVSAPSGSYPAGAAIMPAFAVQVMGADGVTPGAKQNVTFAASDPNVKLAACGSAPCVVMTDAKGVASTGSMTGAGPGTVSLTAADNGLTQTASFVVAQPNVLAVISAPQSVFQGGTSGTAFAVSVMSADGATPKAGVPVVLSLGPGSGVVQFSACGGAPCSALTDANGLVSSLVIGTKVGVMTLVATAQLPSGNQIVSAPMHVLANILSLSALEPSLYVPEGVSNAAELDVSAMENGAVSAGQVVTWIGAPGLVLAGQSATTDAAGRAAVQAVVGPLRGGATAMATACAWTTICTEFKATGVSVSAWRIAVVSGGGQTANGGAALSAVTAQVTDGAGHPLAGTTVTIGQTVRALDVACPIQGRCPASPVLASGTSSAVSDKNGNVSVTPMVVVGTATETAIEFSVGTQGFATAKVSSTP